MRDPERVNLAASYDLKPAPEERALPVFFDIFVYFAEKSFVRLQKKNEDRNYADVYGNDEGVEPGGGTRSAKGASRRSRDARPGHPPLGHRSARHDWGEGDLVDLDVEPVFGLVHGLRSLLVLVVCSAGCVGEAGGGDGRWERGTRRGKYAGSTAILLHTDANDIVSSSVAAGVRTAP